MSSKDEDTAKNDTSNYNTGLLRDGAFIVWVTFWFTWLILAVISNSLGNFKLVLNFAILTVLFGTLLVATASNWGGRNACLRLFNQT